MAETLLAILLVTSSAKGSSLVYCWPPSPTPSVRLTRPRPDIATPEVENTYRAAVSPEAVRVHAIETFEDREWARDDYDFYYRRKPRRGSSSRPSSGRTSPSKEHGDRGHGHGEQGDETDNGALEGYAELLGFQAEFLASLLCPQRALCHQKFELVLDDIAFLGHPVCETETGRWTFKAKPSGRGRVPRSKMSVGTPARQGSRGATGGGIVVSVDQDDGSLASSEDEDVDESPRNSSLQTFQLVLVLDIPDPSSSASGNLESYLNVIYEQVAFLATAVLYEEQVTNNFVEDECDALTTLKEEFFSRGDPYVDFCTAALKMSTIASSMKSIYEAIKSRSIATFTVHDLSLQLQLPPHLDSLLHTAEDQPEFECDYDEDVEGLDGGWGHEMGFAWKLPSLVPWKSLLLMDDTTEAIDPLMNLDLRGPNLSEEDHAIAEGLVRFLQTASITVTLSEMADALDWSLEGRVYPTVRWLVRERRAKIVDTVHRGLKTVFTLPPTFPTPISELSAQFRQAFPDAQILSLPQILARLSAPLALRLLSAPATSAQTPLPASTPLAIPSATSAAAAASGPISIPTPTPIRQTPSAEHELTSTNTFFARIVRGSNTQLTATGGGRDRDRLPMYHNVVRWMLQRDLLIRLHLRVRIIVPVALKDSVREARARARMGAKGGLGEGTEPVFEGDSGSGSGSRSGSGSGGEKRRDTVGLDDPLFGDDITTHTGGSIQSTLLDASTSTTVGLSLSPYDRYERDEDSASTAGEEDEDALNPTYISDPGRATPLERRYLAAMSEGKDSVVVRCFDRINQYFDGKRSDEEILYRAEISRRQLREVLGLYGEYLQTFMHPS